MRMTPFLYVLVTLLAVAIAADTTRPLITPTPQNMNYGTERLEINDCVSLQTNFNDDYFMQLLSTIYNPVLFRKSGLQFGSACKLSVNIQIGNPTIDVPKGLDTAHEKYTLEVDANGVAAITADYKMGVIRAMDTLAQLFEYKNGQMSLPHLPLTINDEPRYPYRGISMDVSREFYPIDTLKRVIDGLRMTKINHLHLHLSDDDSIPVQFPSYPDMVKYTALSENEFYTAKQLKGKIGIKYTH